MPPSAVPKSGPWFVQAFERIYLHIYPHRDDTEAEANASDICRLLGVRAGQRVLDVACGAGRYARALARRGLRVTGVDLSADLLEEALERSPNLPGSPDYLRWDIRKLPFMGQFEGAVSLFTSFGYFDERSDDFRIMEGVHRALVPGGCFLVDYLNEVRVRSQLQASSERAYGKLRVTLQRRIEEDAPGGPRVVKHVRAVHVDTGLLAADYEERVRLYEADEIDELLREAGFELVGGRHGDFDGGSWDDDSPRLLRVARRVG